MDTIKDMTLDELEYFIEEKILEASEDPDSSLQLKDEIIDLLQKRREDESEISHDEIVEEYG